MKFCVLGLGRFGYQVAEVLGENGMEVMAVDKNESIIASIKDKVTQAICMQVIDEESLRSIGVDEMDTVIVAMAAFDQSVLITTLVKKHLKIENVIARASSEIHKDILKLLGADRVVLPEKEIGIRIADNLSSPFTDLIRLTKHFAVSQIMAPQSFVGKTIQDLHLYDDYHIRCIGLRESDERISPIDPSYVVKENDKLIFAGINKELEKLTKL